MGPGAPAPGGGHPPGGMGPPGQPPGTQTTSTDFSDPAQRAQIMNIDKSTLTDAQMQQLAALPASELERMGYFDSSAGRMGPAPKRQVGLAKASAVADFAASVANAVPVKKIVSPKIEALSTLNLYRDPSDVYFPKNRHKSTIQETYNTPPVLDLQVGMFVIPERVPLTTLCPSKRINDEVITNIYKFAGIAANPNQNATQAKAMAANLSPIRTFWGQTQFAPSENLKLKNGACTIVPFVLANGTSTPSATAFRCATKTELLENSKDKYRVFCVEDMPPANLMSFIIAGAFTGHWLYPEAREDRTDYVHTKPEWTMDILTEYFFILDRRFLDVEEQFMKGQQDYVNGARRLWAAEPLIRGAARCPPKDPTAATLNYEVAECAATTNGVRTGVPANPPSVLPNIRLRTNRQKTNNILDGAKPQYWPKEQADRDELYQKFDQLSIDILPGLRKLSAAEDGYVALKPMISTTIKVVSGKELHLQTSGVLTGGTITPYRTTATGARRHAPELH